MMKLRPFSEHPCSLFVSIDGPSGAGKSTIVHHLAQLLTIAGEDVHVTSEPRSGPIGTLCRELTETTTGSEGEWPRRCRRRSLTTACNPG
ncbi:MAG: dTMP kinase [Pseudonocardiaceae bacterium]